MALVEDEEGGKKERKTRIGARIREKERDRRREIKEKSKYFLHITIRTVLCKAFVK